MFYTAVFVLLHISSAVVFSEETTTLFSISDSQEVLAQAQNSSTVVSVPPVEILKGSDDVKSDKNKDQSDVDKLVANITSATTTTTTSPPTTTKTTATTTTTAATTTTKTTTTTAKTTGSAKVPVPRSSKRQIPPDTDILNAVAYNETLITGVKDLTEDLDLWEAPHFIRKNYPYYLSGYDDDDRPIWSAELGKFDLRYIVEQGGDLLNDFEKYAKQAARRVIVSIANRSTEERPVTEALFLVDFDGLQLRQVSYVPSLAFLIRLALSYRDLIVNHLGATVVINANFVAENLIRIFKPMFGPAMAKVEIYGTNKQKWIPVVRRIFGTSQIPEWYGGSNKNYKPVAIFG